MASRGGKRAQETPNTTKPWGAPTNTYCNTYRALWRSLYSLSTRFSPFRLAPNTIYPTYFFCAWLSLEHAPSARKAFFNAGTIPTPLAPFSCSPPLLSYLYLSRYSLSLRCSPPSGPPSHEREINKK